MSWMVVFSRLDAALSAFFVVIGLGLIGIVVAHATRTAPPAHLRGRPEFERDWAVNAVMLLVGAFSVAFGASWLGR